MNINYNKILNFSKPFLFLFLLAFFISTLGTVFLPKNSIEYNDYTSANLAYKEYKGFYSDFANEEKKGSKAADKTKKLSSYKLKAIYAKEDLSGWAIVEPQNKKKSLILEQNSKLDGYILTKLFKDYIIFQKNNIEYKLEIIKNKNMKYEIQRVDSKKEKIIAKGNNIKLQRNYLNQYVNDVEKVWENIKISDFKKDGKLDGFKINKINRNSVFAKLGLKKGDIIKSINGNRLKSYADAFKVYNNINKIDYLNLQVQRDKKMVEINYEID